MEELIYSLENYKILAMIVGFICVFVETFLPILPLTAIVIANAFALGMLKGLLISWTGSSIGSIGLYYVANKFSDLEFLKKYKRKDNVAKIMNYIKKQGFNAIFIAYSCPFIPDFLITITSGFVGFDIKTYLSGMVFGKLLIFLILSYLGDDMGNLLYNPIKIVVCLFAILISFAVGKKVNKRIHK